MKQKFQQRKTRRGWETSVGWKMAGARIIAGAVLAAGVMNAGGAWAQGPAKDSGNMATAVEAGQQPPGPAGSHEFAIAGGPLKAALDTFHDVTGLRVKIRIGAEDLDSFHTAGVQGAYTNSAALHHLLEKTGLSFVFGGTGTVEIAVRNSESVDVNAAIASVSLQQFPQPLVDTAQSVNVVPQFIMQDQAATGLRDTLRDAPGISIAAGEGGSQGDSLTIRGFNARNDIFLDGIRDFGSYYRDSFNYQSVDVLEGPASVEFGRGSTGGVVNQESKQPEAGKFIRGNVQFGTDLMRRGSIDINTPIKAIPESAFRLNVAGEQSGIAGRDIAQTRRFGVAPSLEFGMNSRTRVVLSYLHEFEDSVPDYGLPYFGSVVAPVARTTFYGFANGSYLKTQPDILTGKVEHDFNPHITMRNVFRFANYPRDVRITEPQVNTVGTLAYSNADGKNVYENAATKISYSCLITATPSTSCYSVNADPSLVFVKRNQLTSESKEDILWDQITTSINFSVGRIANNAVVLVEGGRERSRPLRVGYAVPYVPLLNPNPYDAFAATVTPAVRVHVESQSFGIDFLDTMKLTQWLQLSGGVRFDYFDAQSSTPANTAVTPITAAAYATRLDKQPTYHAAVVVKPRQNGSVYFDYGTSFNPAAESLSLSANNAVSAPEYNETFEAGVKWSYLHDRLGLNSSVFRTEKLNARETDPTNSANTINAGNQLVRGVQLGVLGHMPQNFDLIAGYAYLDGRVESSVVNGSPIGNVTGQTIAFGNPGCTTIPGVACAVSLRSLMLNANDPRANSPTFFLSPSGFALANVPKNAGNVFVTHRLLWRVTGGFGGNYVGARRASSTAVVALPQTQGAADPSTVPFAFRSIPGYTILNAMVRRPLTERIDLQVNINNLANKFFIDQPHPSHLVPGEGLNAQFGLNYKF